MGIAEVPFFLFCISKIVIAKAPLFLELDFVSNTSEFLASDFVTLSNILLQIPF
jgi:hypothetical protein